MNAHAQDSEAQMVAYMKTLYEMEDEGERTTISIGPFTAISMIGILQLGTRHPGLSKVQLDIIRSIIRQLEPLFTGTPGEEIIKMGNHPEFDV
jgi:hypothetical protein